MEHDRLVHKLAAALGVGYFVLEPSGVVRSSNDVARDMVAGLAPEQVSAFLAGMRQDANGDTGPPARFISDDGRKMLIVEHGGAEADMGAEPAPRRFLILDLAAPRGSIAADFSRVFGLTPAETEVLCRLLAGENVNVIAANRANTAGTVRTHVKSLLAKTGTENQRDLVAVALRTNAILAIAATMD